MKRVFVSLAILSCVSLNHPVEAQTSSDLTAPTEVGNTTMPPGQYTMIEQTTGKKYSLMVTTKGTMICGPAAAVPASTAVAVPAAQTPAKTDGIKGLAETQMQKGMSTLIQKEGMSEIKKLMK